VSVDNRAQVDVAALAEIEAAVAQQRSLQDVVRDTFARGQTICEVIVQDEFTHDVVVPWRELYLVYDTT
jgi:hypothetical protein